LEPVRVLEEKRVHLLDYWRIVRRRRWIIIAAVSLVVAVVATRSFMARPIYRATAQIEIGSENLKVLSFQEGLTVDTSDPQYYQTHYELLKSDTLMKKVIERMKLDH
jgi:polysaccharide biosynthesis transport protein